MSVSRLWKLCGRQVYVENIWEMVVQFIKDWGLCCAGANWVSFQGGVLVIEE
ncbi:hypothetical protein QJS10_CPA10g00687 [Acorus calamus]|uniref:Uncharacterized protein n=1 Tax=Acorus calamus TaxID=4465 RepID=A0AAV9DY53_ACOCL|nr:hypothetical protein QJS10_CPA10g00687 [Acorus calamus]